MYANNCFSTGIGRGTSYTTSEPEILAGTFNPAQRLKEVRERLQTSFEAIRKMDLRNDEKSGGIFPGFGRGRGGKAKPEDVVVMSLKALENEISELEQDVRAYEGPHFTKNYRTLQGLCSKLQTDLDALDVTGREDIRRNRKAAIIRVEELAKDLSSRAHPDGEPCKDCEVQN